MTRYNNRTIARNEEQTYKDVLENRGVKHIDHYLTPSFPTLSVYEALQVTRLQHVWKFGDKLWKLSEQYYGDGQYWWLIAWYNDKPTESHYIVGQTLIIPVPFERALALYNGVPL
jgi:nucleoid-associated protein YgaU